MARIPNLFVIGAMKSGTSSLCRSLSEHPAIFMSPEREPNHFSHQENWSRGHEQYLRLFQHAADERYLAEGSTAYSKRPFREGVAPRIHQFNPEARIVYVLRDPFARMVSEYRHEIRMGREHRYLDQAIRQQSTYLANSYYAYQLKPYLELFGREAVYVDTFETMVAAPAEFLGRLFAWLRIDAGLSGPAVGHRDNVSPEVMEAFEENRLRVRFWRLFRRYRKIVRLIPASARRWYKAHLPREFVRDIVSAEFRLEVEQARRLVEPLLSTWIQELSGLTGRAYEEWPSATGVSDIEPQDARLAAWLPEGIPLPG
jgi:hypothetical protein